MFRAGHQPGGPAETPEYKHVMVCAQANAREPTFFAGTAPPPRSLEGRRTKFLSRWQSSGECAAKFSNLVAIGLAAVCGTVRPQAVVHADHELPLGERLACRSAAKELK
jgi:hypothetical protein